MAHIDIQEFLGVYALDAVDDRERRMIDTHLAQCSECRAEVASHREVASKLATDERPAPIGAWKGIADGMTSPVHAVVPLRRRWLQPVVVAAALTLFAAAAIVQTLRLQGVTDDLRSEQETVAALNADQESELENVVTAALGDPGAQLVSLGSEASDVNAIIVLMPDGTGYLTQHTLQPLPSDRTYQLWAITDGVVISAGVLGSDPDVTPFHIDVTGFEGFAITEEAAGGVVASQNQPVVAWLGA